MTINSVTGQVTDANGTALPGATVSLVDASYMEIARTTTDSNGTFGFQNVGDSGTGYVKAIVSYVHDGKTYNLTKMPAAWYSSNASSLVINGEETSLASYPPVPETIRPGDIFTATGQVTDANGKPLQGAEVHLYDGIYKEIGVTTSDASGNFGFINASTATSACKVQVFYTAGGKVYRTSVPNVLWYPTDTGIVKFSQADTRVEDYPESSTGYLWGIIVDNTTGRSLNGEVYLNGEKRHMSIKTSESGNFPAFLSEVPTGEYTVYAISKDVNGSMESKPVTVMINPSRNYLDNPSVMLLVDQPVAPEDLKPVALLGAILVGLVLLGGIWFGLRRF